MIWKRVVDHPNIFAYHACLYYTEDGYMFIGSPTGKKDKYYLSMSDPPCFIKAKVIYYINLQELPQLPSGHGCNTTDVTPWMSLTESSKKT